MIKIVFFPYQATMWDSFDTIWQAAMEDPRCEVSVVPIPYYELTATREFVNERCDNRYPKNVPIMDWRDYDLEAHHPNIIYTHYAYDDVPDNASIHPDFYSERLRRHCDLLIHVPYFVTQENVLRGRFSNLPGVMYAHYVIVQSEEIRQHCIDEYKRLDKKLGWSGRYGKANKKYIALGSPKFDKMINAKPEDFELPDEWQHLICKPDGSKKIVILYNTHALTWLRTGDRYFEKVKQVFDTFRNRHDAVLWWRPHPHTELNFRARQPQWLDKYLNLVNEYKCDAFGIYDDTEDLHRAISMTTGYYGDLSSLAALYRCTGKPILFQNTYLLHNNRLPSLPVFCSDSVEENIIWVQSVTSRELYRLDANSLEYRFIGQIPSEDPSFVNPRYSSMVMIQNKIYFFPERTNGIAVYDVCTENFSEMLLPRAIDLIDYKLTNGIHFHKAIVFGSCIFLMPHSFPAIVKYNTSNSEFEQITDWIVPLKKSEIGKTRNHNRFFGWIKKVDSYIYATSDASNIIFVFNMETNRSEFYRVGEKEQVFSDICFDGKCFWLLDQKGENVVRWDKARDKWKSYEIGNNGVPLLGLVEYFAGQVWLFPWWSKIAVQINTDDFFIKPVKAYEGIETAKYELDKNLQDLSGDECYWFSEVVGSYIVTYFYPSNKIAIYEPGIEKVRVFDIIADPISYADFNCEKPREYEYYDISNYITELSLMNDETLGVWMQQSRHKYLKSDFFGMAGTRIHSFVTHTFLR